MNAAIMSSKRFVVSEHDFEQLRNYGKLEYLIQFRFVDPDTIASFETEYLAAGLENNGPSAITSSLIRLANAMSDGIMIAVLILISLLVTVVAFLCIRFTLLAKVEEDYREIGVMKAIGLRVSHIKKLYLAKYGAIAAIAGATGFLLSIALQGPFMENIRLFMGGSGNALLGTFFGVAGAVAIFLVILLYVNGILRRFRKISAAQAIRFGAPRDKAKATRLMELSKNRVFPPNVFLGVKDVFTRRGLYATMLLVLIISSFLLVTPQNIYSTLSARSFMTNMGIGMCDTRFDIQQTDNILDKTAEVDAFLQQDEAVAKHAVLISRMFEMRMDDGATGQLKVEMGDHTAFPVEYSNGKAPGADNEIALSTANADDLSKTVSDHIVLIADGVERTLTVCGLYSDITNGGRTAKAVFPTNQTDILWATIPVEFRDKTAIPSKIAEYRALYPYAKVADIDGYIDQTYGSAIVAIQAASYAAIVATALLAILITLLFMKMLVAKDRYSIAVLKSVGFTSRGIKWQYLTRSAIVLALGVIIGTALANTLGELLGAGFISSFGASSFRFNINPLFAYVFSPLLIAACVLITTALGISDIRKLKISEHIKE
jgi:putative ABC transport system permease protein